MCACTTAISLYSDTPDAVTSEGWSYNMIGAKRSSAACITGYNYIENHKWHNTWCTTDNHNIPGWECMCSHDHGHAKVQTKASYNWMSALHCLAVTCGSDVSADSSPAQQSHLCRTVRRVDHVCSFTPVCCFPFNQQSRVSWHAPSQL